jgi:hypothetical protein
MSKIVVRTIFIAIFSISMSWVAHASQWVASKVAQPAHYSVDNKHWIAIKRGTAMPKESWIKTGRRGRLILRRGKEMIMYRSGTLAYLQSSQTGGRKTYIQQQVGSLLLDVETRKRKHVTVQTPLLAAVVKGTRFEVTVRNKKATVSVKRGVVGVRSNKGRDSFDVKSGQTAAVSSSSASQVSVSGSRTSAFFKQVQKFTSPADPNVKSNGKSNSNANGKSNGNASGKSSGKSNDNANGNSNGGSSANNNGNGNGNGKSSSD